ncbi:hypothetical protein DICVIV_09929 [Dictyocaulus viviparus]|uniref:Uncharacterized protein n=1 Tax=Dictyocaulus viviparus TaxID=29172 RepID=A0A0D8XH98_DICVI|nr:hypothetical protein DICVIV_09929 [Dictyocaulus viviparus]
MESSEINVESKNFDVKASQITRSYLLSTAEYALDANLPLCLASAWSSKAKSHDSFFRMRFDACKILLVSARDSVNSVWLGGLKLPSLGFAFTRENSQDVLKACLAHLSTASKRINNVRCIRCGISFRNKRAFDLKIKDEDDSITVEGFCCGCKQSYYCGKIKRSSCLEQPIEEFVDDADSILLEKTFDERNICASSTPLNKREISSTTSPRSSDPRGRIKHGRRRRGSALERLLKEEDSVTDHSLSGFLKMLSK